MSNKFSILFFLTTQGRSPVQDYIDQLPHVQQAKVLRQLLYLQEFGLSREIPNNKKLQGTPLWELRVLGKSNIRVFYASTGKKKITILHIFEKKSQKTAKKEIEMALNRYKLAIDL